MKYFELFKCKSFLNKGTKSTHVHGETFVQLAESEQLPAFLPWKVEVHLVREMIRLVILPPPPTGTNVFISRAKLTALFQWSSSSRSLSLHLFPMPGIFKIILLSYNLKQ